MKEKAKNEMNKDDFREMAGKIQNIEDSEELRKILGNIILDRLAREDGQNLPTNGNAATSRTSTTIIGTFKSSRPASCAPFSSTLRW